MITVRHDLPCQVMGVLNVTPDSFSDGGLFEDRHVAVAHGVRLAAQGADLVDVGGESTRPGAERVSAETELARVVPVVQALVAAGVTVSIDTMRARVAAEAIAAGASVINDVSGGLADEGMADLVRRTGVPYVVMHWRGHSQRAPKAVAYADVISEVGAELQARVDVLVGLGVRREQIVLDPGIGFAKLAEQSWQLLGSLPKLNRLGLPLLVGASRKSLLGDLADGRSPLDPADRDFVTAVISAAIARHVAYVRVHDVRSTVLALRVADRLDGGFR